jgi:glutamate-1-semialdehyde 2,1-aminomutase
MSNNNNMLFERACKVIPGGVNSPVRSFAGVGKSPVFINRAEGSYLFGTDGKKYIDYIGSWGPMLFGHAWSPLLEAVKRQLSDSVSIGLATGKEVEFAELLVSMVPGVEKVRLVNSGTEACMTAVRIARGVTGRKKIIKFNGCYHGHADTFLVKAGSGLLTLQNPSSPGVLPETAEHTLVAEFNNLAGVEQLFEENPDQIAAIIVEPVAGNMGCIPPAENFLEGLRNITRKHSACLIFDEVMTGFRLAAGGAQEYSGIEADLVTFGKIIGGGFPVGAIAGKNRWMDCLAPIGSVYQAGTLSGNPVATTAGITMLTEIRQNPGIYSLLEENGEKLQSGLNEVFRKADIPVQINRVGSMISLFFTAEKVTTFNEVEKADMKLFSAFFHEMLENGVHLPPSGYESWFMATSHTPGLIDFTIDAAEKSVKKIHKNR